MNQIENVDSQTLSLQAQVAQMCADSNKTRFCDLQNSLSSLHAVHAHCALWQVHSSQLTGIRNVEPSPHSAVLQI